MNVPNFSITNLHLKIPTANILLVILVLAVVIFGVISSALIYHWRKYGMGRRKFFFVQLVYVLGAAVFIGAAALSLIFV